MTSRIFGFPIPGTRTGYVKLPDKDPVEEETLLAKTPPWGRPFDLSKAKAFVRDRIRNEPGLANELWMARTRGYDCVCSYGQGSWTARCDQGKLSFQFLKDDGDSGRHNSVGFKLDEKKQVIFL